MTRDQHKSPINKPEERVTMNAYAKAGVDYTKIEPFKDKMIAAAKRTVGFPEERQVFINTGVLHSHGGIFRYEGNQKHAWCNTMEGLGNKNWIAEWMYKFDETGNPRYRGIGIDTAMMAVNDCIAQGALPVAYVDEVAAGDSEWFADTKRAEDLAQGFYEACAMSGMALVAGESPALKYLVRAEAPVKSAPSLSGCVTGIIAPLGNLIDGSKLTTGDRIIGITSSGVHANGISLVIKRAMELPMKFLAKLPNGHTLGEEALKPTRCYVRLIEALLEDKVDIHALLPGTGSGIAKVAFDHRPHTYRIHSWPEVPMLFRFMQELGIPDKDCVTTFNWGVGYYIFAPASAVDRILSIARTNGYEALEVGRVEDGERKTIFGPMNDLILPPPGE
jgi:phosphoribosylformylglycinamidine cyclo-ligase